MSRFLLTLFCGLIMSTPVLRAHEIAVKSNLLYDLTGTINVGAELGVAPQWSVDLSCNLNAWKFGHRSWRHVLVQPEARYWPAGTMGGHFFSVNVLTGYYNAGCFNPQIGVLGWHWDYLKTHTFEGWAYGFGVGYGYCFMLNRHWNLELEAAIGYIRADYDCWKIVGHEYSGHFKRNYFGPTKLAVSMSYVF